MKGLVSYPNGNLKLEDTPLPKIGGNLYSPHDVLLKVEYCGICGSDIHRWNTDKTGVKNPPRKVVIGHEIVGRVVEIGKEKNKYQVVNDGKLLKYIYLWDLKKLEFFSMSLKTKLPSYPDPK